MFKRVVVIVEILALVAAAGFVVFLFVNEPDDGASAGGESSPGAEIFAANCARCHGADGGGGLGPQLSGGAVVDAYPDPADEIAVVTDGQGAMPGFAGSLSSEEIATVVDYTRTGL